MQTHRTVRSYPGPIPANDDGVPVTPFEAFCLYACLTLGTLTLVAGTIAYFRPEWLAVIL